MWCVPSRQPVGGAHLTPCLEAPPEFHPPSKSHPCLLECLESRLWPLPFGFQVRVPSREDLHFPYQICEVTAAHPQVSDNCGGHRPWGASALEARGLCGLLNWGWDERNDNDKLDPDQKRRAMGREIRCPGASDHQWSGRRCRQRVGQLFIHSGSCRYWG